MTQITFLLFHPFVEPAQVTAVDKSLFDILGNEYKLLVYSLHHGNNSYRIEYNTLEKSDASSLSERITKTFIKALHSFSARKNLVIMKWPCIFRSKSSLFRMENVYASRPMLDLNCPECMRQRFEAQLGTRQWLERVKGKDFVPYDFDCGIPLRVNVDQYINLIKQPNLPSVFCPINLYANAYRYEERREIPEDLLQLMTSSQIDKWRFATSPDSDPCNTIKSKSIVAVDPRIWPAMLDISLQKVHQESIEHQQKIAL